MSCSVHARKAVPCDHQSFPGQFPMHFPVFIRQQNAVVFRVQAKQGEGGFG
jgi:hypothetical protein